MFSLLAKVTYPLSAKRGLLTHALSVLGSGDCSIHLSGQTGTGKTEYAALAEQHFGPGLNARNLPASWSSTANALEGLAFYAKDALLVVDDFAPAGSQYDIGRFHRDADRLIRAPGYVFTRAEYQTSRWFRRLQGGVGIHSPSA